LENLCLAKVLESRLVAIEIIWAFHTAFDFFYLCFVILCDFHFQSDFIVPGLSSHTAPLIYDGAFDYVIMPKKPLLIAVSKKQGLIEKLYVLCYILTN
jgi:hypothetical protein